MSTRVNFCCVLILCVALLFTGCQRKVVIEGEEGEAIARKGEISEEERLAKEKEEIEASLQTKRYPGIEGEVFESSMLMDIHFAFDRYDLSARAREKLTRNAEFILKFPEAKLQIEGHCDERGTNEYNLALGERRAKTVIEFYTMYGVDASRLSMISYGEERPFDTGHNEESWAKNRRAHMVTK